MGQDDLLSRELVSALVDGQLRGIEFARVVESLSKSDEALEAWHAYHVIGDTLRCADLAVRQDDCAFVSRWRERMSSVAEAGLSAGSVPDEPPVAIAGLHIALTGSGDMRRAGANDSVVRWKWFAGVASLAAVAAIGWQLAGGGVGFGPSTQLAAIDNYPATVASAATQSDVPGSGERQVMLRDARLDELLAAHKQFGGTSALQMPAGFLRNATFESPGR